MLTNSLLGHTKDDMLKKKKKEILDNLWNGKKYLQIAYVIRS